MGGACPDRRKGRREGRDDQGCEGRAAAPKSRAEDELAIYDFISELHETARQREAYGRLNELLGDAGTVEWLASSATIR